MAEEQMVVFKLGDEEYAVPISEVREIIRYSGVTKIPNAPRYMEGILNLRGSVLPVINLAGRFNQTSVWGEETKVIIIESGAHYLGIIVDEVTEVLSIPAGQIEAPPSIITHNAAIRGIGKLEGRLLILLNLQELFSQEELEDFQEVIP